MRYCIRTPLGWRFINLGFTVGRRSRIALQYNYTRPLFRIPLVALRFTFRIGKIVQNPSNAKLVCFQVYIVHFRYIEPISFWISTFPVWLGICNQVCCVSIASWVLDLNQLGIYRMQTLQVLAKWKSVIAAQIVARWHFTKSVYANLKPREISNLHLC